MDSQYFTVSLEFNFTDTDYYAFMDTDYSVYIYALKHHVYCALKLLGIWVLAKSKMS